MNQLAPVIPKLKHRRRFTPEFKQQALDACEVPGQSVTSVARQYDLSANLLHKWRGVQHPNTPSDFVRLPKPVAQVVSADTRPCVMVRIELSGGVIVHWPITAIEQSVLWLKAMICE